MTATIPRSQAFIPDPWDWASYRAAIEQVRGRPLLLAPVERLSSLWIATSDADLILYPGSADQIRQLREIAHQAAHVLLGHQPAPYDAGHLFPHLDPELVTTVLAISRYSQADEQAAAEFAARVVTAALAAAPPEGPARP